MPPKFSLQSVLDYRHSRVEALELEFSRLVEAHQQGLAMRAECQQGLDHLYERLQAEQSGDLDLFAIEHLRSDALSSKNQLDQIIQALAVLEEQIEAKRKEIVAARQGEETLNTLKEKEIDRWQLEQALSENRQQDNIYIAQAFRRANGNANV
jgi:flagellar export protein FliJ